MVAAAEERQQSAASLLGMTKCGRRAPKRSFCGGCFSACALLRKVGVFSKQTTAATSPFCACGTILPGCFGATAAARWPIDCRALSSGTWSTTVLRTYCAPTRVHPGMVQAIAGEAAKLLMEESDRAPLSRLKSKVLIHGSETLKKRRAIFAPIFSWTDGGGRR